jgi:hypothetical protein
MSNPIQYTSRDFDSILADINSQNDLVDKPNWFKRLISGIGDIFSMWENASANNMFLRTAFTRRATEYLLELIDYQMSNQTTSSGNMIFYIKGSTTFPLTVAYTDLTALSNGNSTVASKRFEAHSASPLTITTPITEIVASASIVFATGKWTISQVYITGEKVRLTTSSALPAPLSISTDYYVILSDSTHIKFASSLVNAYNGTAITLTDSGVGNQTISRYSFSNTLYQQETKTQYIVGNSDGATAWQEFSLKDLLVLDTSIVVVINSVTWTAVDTFVNSTSISTHYRLLYNSDGTSYIIFGNGVTGAIPGAFPIYVTYAVGGGIESNISAINTITVYTGANSNIEGCSNPGTMTGGSDEEAIENAKINGPQLLKARDRFVTESDAIALALNYGGISQAFVNRNAYGILSAQILCIANGGGNLTAPVKAALQTYLIDRTVLESVDVRVEDISFVAENVISAAKILTNYTWAGVLPYFRLAWKLFFSETGYEIYLNYLSNGIESATTLINSIFTETFTSADYNAIRKLLISLVNYYRTVNDAIQISDAYAFIQGNVDGIDYVTISAPTFPISNSLVQCCTTGSLTLTQI